MFQFGTVSEDHVANQRGVSATLPKKFQYSS